MRSSRSRQSQALLPAADPALEAKILTAAKADRDWTDGLKDVVRTIRGSSGALWPEVLRARACLVERLRDAQHRAAPPGELFALMAAFGFFDHVIAYVVAGSDGKDLTPSREVVLKALDAVWSEFLPKLHGRVMVGTFHEAVRGGAACHLAGWVDNRLRPASNPRLGRAYRSRREIRESLPAAVVDAWAKREDNEPLAPTGRRGPSLVARVARGLEASAPPVGEVLTDTVGRNASIVPPPDEALLLALDAAGQQCDVSLAELVAVAELSASEAEVFALVCDGLDGPAIARRLQRSAATVRVLKHRAIKKLRRVAWKQ